MSNHPVSRSCGLSHPTPVRKSMSGCSIVLPVKNGGVLLEKVLASLRNQEGVQIDSIVGVDSGSEDDSVSILQRYGVRVIQIPPAEFQHGATRNLGAEGVTSDVMLNTHIPFFPIQSASCGFMRIPHISTAALKSRYSAFLYTCWAPVSSLTYFSSPESATSECGRKSDGC